MTVPESQLDPRSGAPARSGREERRNARLRDKLVSLAIGAGAGAISGYSAWVLPGFGDETSAPILNGIEFANSPERVVTKPLTTIGAFFRGGNFRPLGRVIESIGHYLMWALAQMADIPVFTALSWTRIIAAAIAGTGLAASLWTLSKSSLPAVLIGCGLAIAGASLGDAPLSPLVVFPWLYLVSGGIVTMLIAVAHKVATRVHVVHRTGLWSISAVTIGVAAACTNEIVSLAAVPVLACSAWRWISTRRAGVDVKPSDGAPERTAWFSPACSTLGEHFVRLSAGTSLVATVCIRAVLIVRCSSTECYDASEASIHAPLDLVIHRIASPLSGMTDRPVLVAAIVILLAFGVLVFDVTFERSGAQRVTTVERSEMLVAGLSLWVAAAAMSSMSVEVQTARFPPRVQWREAVLAVPGVVLVIVGLALISVDFVSWFAGSAHKNVATVIALSVFVGLAWWMAADTLRINRQTARVWVAQPWISIQHRLDRALLDFDSSAFGNEGRCSLLAEFDLLHGTADPWHTAQSHQALDLASMERFGTRYCVENS